MKGIRALLASSLLSLAALSTVQPVVAAPQPIHFADLNWESGSLITEILRIMVEQGYGLPTDTLPGTTITLETALANNDIQVIGEEWAGRSPVWVKAEAEGKVQALGDTVKGATEGWWVPEYVIKGDPAKGIKPLAPELRSVTDLARYKDVFKDPESPDKGRFLNSPIGWTSEIVNQQKLKAYGLQDSYVNFRSGSGAALDAEISSAIRRGKPILFYYWSPTPLLGRFKLVQLQEPPFDAEAWKTLTDAANPTPTNPFPGLQVVDRVSTPFQKQYPQLAQFFAKVDLPIEPLNRALAQMSENHSARGTRPGLPQAAPRRLARLGARDVADRIAATL
ncbi:histidine ABC transporter substrate-binding protein [Pseudomonas sp. Boi14]|nr:histidine ABC transporter substrate-binding protein [Pseudomonas sp. Boi14]